MDKTIRLKRLNILFLTLYFISLLFLLFVAFIQVKSSFLYYVLAISYALYIADNYLLIESKRQIYKAFWGLIINIICSIGMGILMIKLEIILFIASLAFIPFIISLVLFIKTYTPKLIKRIYVLWMIPILGLVYYCGLFMFFWSWIVLGIIIFIGIFYALFLVIKYDREKEKMMT